MKAGITLLKPGILRIFYQPAIKTRLIRVPVVRRIYNGWQRTHPMDSELKVDTSGYVPVDRISLHASLRTLINPYAGSSPGVLRRALAALPAVDKYTFVDLGCGKGRAMIVASERPFRSVQGVDLSGDLVAIARRNVAIVSRTLRGRAPMLVHEANAVEFPLPAGKLVLFTYHSFGRELMSQLISALEVKLSTAADHLFFVYYNPVHADVLDASPAFRRWYAGTIKCDRQEIGFAPDDDDTVVIWESVRNGIGTPHEDAGRPVVIVQPAWRAGLAR